MTMPSSVQVRACVQFFDDGDVQGFLYIDNGSGETLVYTSPRYDAGGKGASYFGMSGTRGSVQVSASVDVSGRTVEYEISVDGGSTTSLLSRPLNIMGVDCDTPPIR